jgi:hypothetical protein
VVFPLGALDNVVEAVTRVDHGHLPEQVTHGAEHEAKVGNGPVEFEGGKQPGLDKELGPAGGRGNAVGPTVV